MDLNKQQTSVPIAESQIEQLVVGNVFGKKCDGVKMCVLDNARPSNICSDRLLLHSHVLHFVLKTHDCSVAINDLQLDQSINFSKSSLWQ